MNTASAKHPLKHHVITIDGPSASGKGTLAKRLAKNLRAKYLDTGTIYRAATYLALQQGVNLQNVAEVVLFVGDMDFDFRHVGNNIFETFSNHESIETFIRTPQVDANVHAVATQTAIRQALLERQTGFTEHWKDTYGVILDGRDTGARIYPHATVKFFIQGDVRVRAERRHAQLTAAGHTIPFEDVLADMQNRDERDAPNTLQTPDAHVLDVVKYNADEIEAQAMAIIAQAL